MKQAFWNGIALGAGAVLCLAALGLSAEEPAAAPATESASPHAPAAAGPRIQFGAPIYGFGKVVGGDVVKHDFVFTNSGSETLVISNVTSSCGCTTATNTSKRVEPGKQGTISIEFHTSNFTGPVTKVVKVTSNDPRQPVAEIQVTGTVWRPIEIWPPTAMFLNRVASPSNEVRVLRILNKQEQPLVLSLPHVDRSTISAELRTNVIGRDYELVVKLVPPLGLGNTTAQITLKTSSPQVPLITVPVFAVAQPRR